VSSPVVTTIAGPAAVTVASGILVSAGGAPDPHASTHATAGSDPVSPGSIGAPTVAEAVAFAIALG
jgi:hypothetical protein